ncbi:hypothetical protein GCM10007858_45030 [Bradyrhizobium liaoningense]|uniref:hypothetical protein n=1 Tax=Bradyrhizobium liaoningense TaxID=43992 RepID=UPI00235B8731|nr:hypothetical protein [Bradyrhizobium liaoningense]GLR96864.1 hypothetical protein GCM10007858_45030 [Bradyrhizobium liaoningense]
MRSLLRVGSALFAFAATGCAGPTAAVVVRKPVPAVRCTRVLVNEVYVKRCV